MTPIITPATRNDGTNSWSVTLSRLPQTGESVTVELSFFNNEGATPLTFTDNHGNTWNVEDHVGVDPNSGSFWRKASALCANPAIGAPSTFVITATASASTWGIFTGTACIWPAVLTRVPKISSSGQAVTSASSVTTTTAAPASAPAIAISILSAQVSPAAIVTPSGWTAGRIEQNWAGGPTPFGMAYRDVTAAEAVTATWTFNPADQAAAFTTLFTYSGTGGGGDVSWVCPVAPVRANTRWINPTSGNDSSDGLTKGTAWKRLGNHAIGKAIEIPADCSIKYTNGTHASAGLQYHSSLDGGLPANLTITSETWRGSTLKGGSDGEAFALYPGYTYTDIVFHGICGDDYGDDYGNGWITWGEDSVGVSVIGCKGFNLGRVANSGTDKRQDHSTYIKAGSTYSRAPKSGRIAYNEFSGNRPDMGCSLLHSYDGDGGYLFHDYEVDHNVCTGSGYAWGMLISGGYAPGSNANLNIHHNHIRTTYQTGISATLAVIRFFGSEGGAPNSGVDSSCVVSNNVLAVLGGTAHIVARDSVGGTAHNPTITNNIVYQGGGAALTSNWTLDGSNTVVGNVGDLPVVPTIVAPGTSGPTGTHTATVASGSTVTVTFAVTAVSPSATVTLTRSAGSISKAATFSGGNGTAVFTNVDAGTWTSSISVTDAYGTTSIPGAVVTIVGLSGVVQLPHTANVTAIGATPNVFNVSAGASAGTTTIADQGGIPLPGVVLASSNTSVATASSTNAAGQSTITFNGAGSATITATYNDPVNGLITTQILVVVAGAIPNAPSGLIATPGPNFIDLAWTDNSNNETGFSIRRSDSIGGPYVQIQMTGQNVQTYRDAGLSVGQRFYQVVAVNSIGNSSPSNTASATVTPAPSPEGVWVAGVRITEQAGGSQAVRVTVKDGDGAPISGRTVNASSSGARVTITSSAVTSAQGVALFTVNFVSGGTEILTFTDAVSAETAQLRAVVRA